mmetsp:Transcript_55501/g.166416  ORF Transcript_55501/g.166416 Transcript_55501/m.166416 type:complete len:215 (-) Transcript_55501:128-772(-)
MTVANLSHLPMQCPPSGDCGSCSDISERIDPRQGAHCNSAGADYDSIWYDCSAAASQKGRCYEEPVRFSGGMSHEECEEYYRLLESEERIRSARSKRSRIYKRLRADSRARRSRRRPRGAGAAGGDEDSYCAFSLCTASTGSSSLSSSSDISSMSIDSLSSTKSSSSIRFKESVTVCPMPSIADYSTELCRDLWFPREQASRNLRLAQLAEGCI